MLLYNLVYTVSGRRVVSLLYARGREDALKQIKKSYPSQNVEILSFVRLRRAVL